MKKHPVIIILADQLRRDFVGELTPAINALASESTVFRRAYTTCPLCVPARGSFFTGLYPNSSGSLINPWNPRDHRHGLVRRGTPNLYSTMEVEWDSRQVGKQHFYTEEDIQHSPDSRTRWLAMEGYSRLLEKEDRRKPGGPGFRGIVPEMTMGRFTGPATYSVAATGCYEEGLEYFFDGYIANQAVEAIRSRDASRPLLLNLMFTAPHPPFDIPEPWFSMVDHMALPENVGTWYAAQSPLQLYNYPGLAGARCTRSDWESIWPIYGGLVALLDGCIARVVEELKSAGIYDDAFILFGADHGEMLGSHCLYQKMCMYEEATHIPLMLKLPKGYDHREESGEIVSHIDVVPTLYDFLDIETPGEMQGLSLRRTIEGGAPLDRRHVFLQFDGNGARGNFQRAVVRDGHKLIVDLFKDETYFELYDVESDPQEKANLAFDETTAVRELLSLIEGYMRETGDLISLPEGAYDAFRRDYAHLRENSDICIAR